MTPELMRKILGSQISDRERERALPPIGINSLLGGAMSDAEAQRLMESQLANAGNMQMNFPAGMYNQAPVDNFRISPYGNVSDAEIQRASAMFKLGQMRDEESQRYKEMLPEQFSRSQEMIKDYGVSQGGLSGSYVDKLQEKSKMMQMLKNAISKFRGS